MNFYIGLNFESIYYSGYNVRIDAQIIDYLYKFKVNLNILYDIDPYNDAQLEKEDILKLVADCDLILSKELIKTKDCVNSRGMMDVPTLAFKDLRILCLQAIEEHKNIISIED